MLLPIYKATYERGDEMTSDYPEPTAFYKDHAIMWARDLGRAIDYVETRRDLDAGRIGYFGTSWGGLLGAILPAVEKRIRANVLYVAGLSFQRSLPEVDAVHYVSRVTQPTLMLNGELDFFFPAETSQRPMFELLGTPPEHKLRINYPRGHTVPKVDLIKETLAWLDRYLGPVEWLFTLFALMFFLIGIALFGIGLLGEYIGRVYQQVRHRPRYLVEAILEQQAKDKPKRARKPKAATGPATDLFADGVE